jgi:hypothetical protein
MPACLGCKNGTYQGNVGSTSCNSCEPGKYNLKFAMISAKNCTKCEMGRSNSKVGHGMECTSCKKGKYADVKALTNCKNCPGGYVSEVVASESVGDCEMCPSGFSALPGSSECEICVSGKVAPNPGQAACSLCAPGKWSRMGKEDCYDCAPGEFSRYNNSRPTPCRKCAAGKFSQISGATICTDCSRNTFSNEMGGSKCKKCVGASWTKNLEGSLLCNLCEDGETFPAANMTGGNCEKCMIGRYSLIAGEPFPGCHACPSGATCNGGKHIQVNPGWWVNTGCNKTSGVCGSSLPASIPRQCDADHKDCEDDYTGTKCVCYQKANRRGEYYDRCGVHRVISKCPSPHYCPGNGTCRTGHAGPLCLLCQDDYFMSGGQCETCDISTPASASRVFVMIFIGLIITIAIIYQIAKRSNKLKKYSVVWRDVMRIAKIMVFHIQICQGLQDIYPIDWGDSLIGFFGLFAPLNMDLLDITSVGCQVTLTFYMSYIFVAIVMPCVIIALVYFWYRLRVKFINYEVKNELKKSETEKNNNGETEANKKTRLANLKFKNIVKKVGKPDLKQATKAAVKEMKLGNTATMMLFQAATIIHTPISRKTFQYGNCVDVGDCEYFLKADPRIKCYTLEWWLFFILVAFVGVVFVLGLPIFVWWYLRKRSLTTYGSKDSGKTGLDAPNTIARYGFMYLPYYNRAYFWESEEMFRKMILSGALVYLSRMPALQCCFAICICLFCHVLHSTYHPHRSVAVYRIQHMLLVASFMTFLMGLLSIAQIDTPYQMQIVQTSLLTIHIGVVIVALIATVVSASIAVSKIKKINKEIKNSKVAVVPSSNEDEKDGKNAANLKDVGDDPKMQLEIARKQYGAGSRQYQNAIRSLNSDKKRPTKNV